MKFRLHKELTFLAALTCVFFWHEDSHANAPIELEVIGELDVQARLQRTPKGPLLLSGTLSDEIGHPVSGELRVSKAIHPNVMLKGCTEEMSSPKAHDSTGILRIPPSGKICAHIQGIDRDLSISVRASHFAEKTKVVPIEGPEQMPAPRFVTVPQTIDIGSHNPVTVEVLTHPDGHALPPHSRLALWLACANSTPYPIEEGAVESGRLRRFEFSLVEGGTPGVCELVAENAADGHPRSQTKRQVLVRGLVVLELVDRRVKSEVTRLVIRASTVGSDVDEGLVEVRRDGVFVVGSPLEKGQAILELDQTSKAQSLVLSYVPSSPSFVAGKTFATTIKARSPSPTRTTLHILLLIFFASWLGYAWLRPKRIELSTEGSTLPPIAIVRSSGGNRGSISGSVQDAHTGRALANVLLQLKCPGVEKSHLVEKTSTNSFGDFQFKTDLARYPILKLEASCGSHMKLVSPVTRTIVSVHMTELRRALVQNLVDWARARGSPWYRGQPPTPGELEVTAQTERVPKTEQWARNVTAAAYAPAAPSEKTVNALRSPVRQNEGLLTSEDNNFPPIDPIS